jgi:ABC-type cobalamin transport system permease subunit
MSRFTCRSLPTGLAAASLLVLVAAAAPVRAQTPSGSRPEPALVDDSLTNGALIGAGAGAGVGIMTVLALSTTCDVSKSCIHADETADALVVGIGAGAGIGLIAGMLIDKARRDPPPVAVAIRADRQERAVRLRWSF